MVFYRSFLSINKFPKFVAIWLSAFGALNCECMRLGCNVQTTSNIHLQQQTNIDINSADPETLRQLLLQMQRQNALKDIEIEQQRQTNSLMSKSLQVEQARLAQAAQQEANKGLEAEKIIQELREQRASLEDYNSKPSHAYVFPSRTTACDVLRYDYRPNIKRLKEEIKANEERLQLYKK